MKEMSTTILQKYTPSQQLAPDVLFFDAGGSTFHTHTCPSASTREAHTWICNSPYCQTLTELCPDHGGESPVKVGREPWKR